MESTRLMTKSWTQTSFISRRLAYCRSGQLTKGWNLIYHAQYPNLMQPICKYLAHGGNETKSLHLPPTFAIDSKLTRIILSYSSLKYNLHSRLKFVEATLHNSLFSLVVSQQ